MTIPNTYVETQGADNFIVRGGVRIARQQRDAVGFRSEWESLQPGLVVEDDGLQVTIRYEAENVVPIRL